MEGLAQIFISVIAFTNVLVPQAQVPQVLGVRIANDSTTQATTTLSNGESTAKTERLREAKEQRIEAQAKFKAEKEERFESRQEKRKEFQERLTKIRDEKKQDRLTKLDEKLANANTRWTDHWMKVLDRLISILARVQSRIDKLAERGVDTSAVQAQVTAAQSEISIAQEAIAAQAAKDYLVNLEDESGINSSAQEQFKLLKSDLTEIKELVTEARTSVREVVVAVAKLSEL